MAQATVYQECHDEQVKPDEVLSRLCDHFGVESVGEDGLKEIFLRSYCRYHGQVESDTSWHQYAMKGFKEYTEECAPLPYWIVSLDWHVRNETI